MYNSHNPKLVERHATYKASVGVRFFSLRAIFYPVVECILLKTPVAAHVAETVAAVNKLLLRDAV